MLKYFLFIAVLWYIPDMQAQRNATYKEFTKEYITYPFSDPNPIPSSSKIYPYYRFDGFTDEGAIKEWKVVILENDFIKVQIMPEIGGKIWTAIDKKNGKPFLYNNDVIKFRDIALRGPWVSGGIEFNYGIIGHTPNSSTPVDYLVRSNENGSVSCFISTLDLLTRTRWVLEIKLEKDKAYFTTESYWFNSAGIEQPYYTWMNAAVRASNDLQFLYPGNHYIGHDGHAENWPIDSEGRNLSYYSQNDFGGSKSFHVLGAHSNYFGALWKDDDFGMIHYSRRGDKLGKKIFLWAQSEQGRIWEDLLTDESGQYVEIQSGRLFNQGQFESSFTPFKQIGFMPYTSASWIEYWYPFKDIEGFTGANLVGAFNIQKAGDSLSIKISPVQFINDSLSVYDKQGKIIATAFVKADPLETIEIKLSLQKEKPAKIELKDHVLDLLADEHLLSRPLKTPENFNADEAYGLYLQGRDLARLRKYKKAEEKINASLAKKPLFIPALVEMARLKLFRMQYDSAFYYSKKALSIDTYDGKANYYYGLAASKRSRYYDALDGFEVASLTPQYRNAAYTVLSHLYMKHNNLTNSKKYALLSLQEDPNNIDALQVLHVLARINHNKKFLQETKQKIKKLNPLNHFIRFETYYQSPIEENKDKFIKLIRNEMPVETFLELAIWYANLGRLEESKQVLELSPRNPVTLYWLAWLNRKGNIKQSKKYLTEAKQTSASFVFPFRQETVPILKWAAKETDSWKPDYFLALIHDFRGNEEEAFAKIETYDEKIEFAPFYILKARTDDSSSKKGNLKYFKNAVQLEPKEWHYGRILANAWSQLGNNSKAVEILKKYYRADNSNYIIGLDLIEAYMKDNRYEDAEKILTSIVVLPFEGANDAREYYRETKLMLAYKAMKNGNYQRSLEKIEEAEKWPQNLGVGKPFSYMIENNLENAMKALIYKKIGNFKLHQKYQEKIKDKHLREESLLEKIKKISSGSDVRIF